MERVQTLSLRLADSTQRRVLELWARVEAGALTSSQFVPLAVAVIVRANTQAVTIADIGLTAEIIRQLRTIVAPLGFGPDEVQVDRRRITGMVADLLDERPDFITTDEELQISRRSRLAQAVRGEPLVTVAGAVQTAMVLRNVPGWTRLVDADPCPVCQRLADGVVRSPATSMARHPGCVVTGTKVSGPRAIAATRRWHRGQLVRIGTASGNFLALTVNHPVLTSDGWVPAGELSEGANVVSGSFTDGALLGRPYEKQVPSCIEEVAAANGMVLCPAMPLASKDFHGDATQGQVGVIWANCLLRNWDESTLAEQRSQLSLVIGDVPAGRSHALDGQRPLRAFLERGLPSGRRCVCGRQLRSDLLRSQQARGEDRRFLRTPDRNAGIGETFTDNGATRHEPAGQSHLALAIDVEPHDLLVRDGDTGSTGPAPRRRFDTPPTESPAYRVGMEAEYGRDLLHRLAGLVQFDRVVEVSITDGWSGHVHNLMTSEGWYEANGLIVSNCGCIQQPVFS